MNIPAANTCEPVRVFLASVLARERTGRSVFVSGFARRRLPTHLCSSEHRTFRVPQHGNCTPGTLTGPRFESAFFASFLCRFGQRNDALPRAVANSDKENIQHITREGLESSNPALTLTTTANLTTRAQPDPPNPAQTPPQPASANAP